MFRYAFAVMALATLILSSSSCSTCPQTDYAECVRALKAAQILNPEAGRNLEACEGLDTVASQKALERYRKTFEEPPAKKSYTLSIGGLHE